MRLAVEKTLAGCVMSVMWAVGMHLYYVRQHSRGYDAFMDYQSARFDKYMALPHWTAGMFLSAALLTVVAICIYEGMTLLFRKART